VVKRYGAEDARPAGEPPTSRPARHRAAAWLLTPAAPEKPPTAAASIRSRRERTGRPGGEAIALRARALQRGVLVHRLLQSLPDLAAERRRELAQNYLARNAEDWTERARGAGGQVLALIADRASPRCLRRQPGRGADRRTAGAADGRLRWVRPDRPPGGDRRPKSSSSTSRPTTPRRRPPPDAPQGYVRQLALYRAVLAKLYPQRSDQGRAALDRNA
jgi:ATP-dependent helicase/nuclease subunit A